MMVLGSVWQSIRRASDLKIGGVWQTYAKFKYDGGVQLCMQQEFPWMTPPTASTLEKVPAVAVYILVAALALCGGQQKNDKGTDKRRTTLSTFKV